MRPQRKFLFITRSEIYLSINFERAVINLICPREFKIKYEESFHSSLFN